VFALEGRLPTQLFTREKLDRLLPGGSSGRGLSSVVVVLVSGLSLADGIEMLRLLFVEGPAMPDMWSGEGTGRGPQVPSAVVGRVIPVVVGLWLRLLSALSIGEARRLSSGDTPEGWYRLLVCSPSTLKPF
jgi:hypothetical protein